MAYRFNSSSDTILRATAPVTALPLTIAGWFSVHTPSDSLNHVLATIGETGTGDDTFYVGYNGTVNSVRAASGVNGAFATSGAAGLSDSKFHHLAGVFTSTTSRLAYCDGAAGTPSTASSNPLSMGKTTIGYYSAGGINYDGSNHDVAEIGIWNIALSAADIALLASGVSPLNVQRANLVDYAPLADNANASFGNFTPTNVTLVEHPTQVRLNDWYLRDTGLIQREPIVMIGY